jgi:signal transduction histidine kinase
MHNLLNVSRIEHGELGYQPEPVNYLDFVRDFVTEMKEQAATQHRKLNLHVPPSLPTLLADPTAVREVLINLVDNGFVHTAAGTGTVAITVSRHRDEIETAVSDNGVGIPPDAIPHLFTKFFRVGGIKNTTHGTGLGLYICKSIVEAHGGHIWVESTPGEGSTFTFRLPLRPPVAHPARPADNEPSTIIKPTTTISRGAHGWIKDHSVH